MAGGGEAQAVLWCLAPGEMARTSVRRKLERVTLCPALSSKFHWN